MVSRDICVIDTIPLDLNEVISIDFVKSKDNITDPITKGLKRDHVVKTLKGM